MIKRNIILLTICFAIVGCGTKKENKESVMDKEIAVISTKFGDIKLEFFDEIAPNMLRVLSCMLKMVIMMELYFTESSLVL